MCNVMDRGAGLGVMDRGAGWLCNGKDRREKERRESIKPRLWQRHSDLGRGSLGHARRTQGPQGDRVHELVVKGRIVDAAAAACIAAAEGMVGLYCGTHTRTHTYQQRS